VSVKVASWVLELPIDRVMLLMVRSVSVVLMQSLCTVSVNVNSSYQGAFVLGFVRVVSVPLMVTV